jgi:hypothetical protein
MAPVLGFDLRIVDTLDFRSVAAIQIPGRAGVPSLCRDAMEVSLLHEKLVRFVRRGDHTWPVRVYNGRDPESKE